jgi:hypothetical protein
MSCGVLQAEHSAGENLCFYLFFAAKPQKIDKLIFTLMLDQTAY